MSRVATMSQFMIGDLFHSLQAVVPPVLTLALLHLSAVPGMKADYFASVGGAAMMFVCLVTTLLFLSRMNRSTTYPLLARLPHRAELLAAILVSAVVLTLAMSVLYVGLAVNLFKLVLAPFELLVLSARWLVLFVFAATLGLNIGKLASRGGWYMLVIGCVTVIGAISSELRFYLLNAGLDAVVESVALVVSPLTGAVAGPAGVSALEPYAPPLLQTLAYAAVLLISAAALFRRKDLLWAE